MVSLGGEREETTLTSGVPFNITKRAKLSPPMDSNSDQRSIHHNLDVDALVDEVLAEDVEGFEIRSSPSKDALETSSEIKAEFYGQTTMCRDADDDQDEAMASNDEQGFEEYCSESLSVDDDSSLFVAAAFDTDTDNDLLPVMEKESHGDFFTSDIDFQSDEGMSVGDGSFVAADDELLLPLDTDSDVFSLAEEHCEFTQMRSDEEAEVEGPVTRGIKSSIQSHPEEIIQEIMTYGPNLFVERQILSGHSPDILLESLGFALPEGLFRADNIGKWNYVRRFLLKHVYERPRLGVSSLEDAVTLIQNSRKILILTGAGISVSCGIPDFRSENGLYSRVRERYDLPEPECMFDIEFFRIDPEPFYSFAKVLVFTRCHYFIRTLETRGQLLRQFTQNIDTLEEAAAINRVVYCHGSFSQASCLTCGNKLNLKELQEAMKRELVPTCEKCEGIIKPDIVFFGEPLPKTFDDHLSTDCNETDLVIVIGSSLKVHPVSSIPDLVPPYIPQILINRESLDHNFDIELLGDCDLILAELFRRLGWTLEDPTLADRFQSLLLQTISSHSIAPNYHLFPGAKPMAVARESTIQVPPRSHASSPPSSEGLIGSFGDIDGAWAHSNLTGLAVPSTLPDVGDLVAPTVDERELLEPSADFFSDKE